MPTGYIIMNVKEVETSSFRVMRSGPRELVKPPCVGGIIIYPGGVPEWP